jgi:hypothetical protein
VANTRLGGVEFKLKNVLPRRARRVRPHTSVDISKRFQSAPPGAATAGSSKKNQCTSALPVGSAPSRAIRHDHLFIDEASARNAEDFQAQRRTRAEFVNASGSGRMSPTALVRGCGGVGEKGPHAARHLSRVPSETSRHQPASLCARLRLRPFGLKLVEASPPNPLQVDHLRHLRPFQVVPSGEVKK